MIPLPVSPELLAKLSALRDARGADEVEREHDAFLIDPGLGAIWLTRDGRILWDDIGPEGILEVTSDNDVITSLVAGAKKTGLTELLELIPPAPADAVVCPECDGTRWGKRIKVVCLLCRGRGWATTEMIEAFAIS